MAFEAETKKFIEEVKQSDVYTDYIKKKEAAMRDFKLWREISDYKKKRFEMQNSLSGEELFDRTESFEKGYEEWKSNKVVSEYLDAELAICRMLQQITFSIVKELDIEK